MVTGKIELIKAKIQLHGSFEVGNHSSKSI